MVKSFYHYYIIKFETADRSAMFFRGSAISRVIEGFPAASDEEAPAHEKRKNGVINRYFACRQNRNPGKALRRASDGGFYMNYS